MLVDKEFARDSALIRDLVAYDGSNPASVAKKAGVAVSTINRPFNGSATNRLGRSVLEKLRKAYPEFPRWDKYVNVAFGLRDERAPYGYLPTVRDPDMVAVRQIDLRFGLGGAFMDTEIVENQAETMDFPSSWLRMITASPPSQLYWARGMGNSMEPAISDGDVILIDRSERLLRFGDLYWAISYGQTAMVKRLRPMPDGGVKILSDNPNVGPETAYDGELNIFGRVIAVVRRL